MLLNIKTPLELACLREHYLHSDCCSTHKIVLQLIDELAYVQGWQLDQWEEQATELNHLRRAEQERQRKAKILKRRSEQLDKSRAKYFKKHNRYPEW